MLCNKTWIRKKKQTENKDMKSINTLMARSRPYIICAGIL